MSSLYNKTMARNVDKLGFFDFLITFVSNCLVVSNNLLSLLSITNQSTFFVRMHGNVCVFGRQRIPESFLCLRMCIYTSDTTGLV